MSKTIITYNVDLPDCRKIKDYENLSLYDADIVVIKPGLPNFLAADEKTRNSLIIKWVYWQQLFSDELDQLIQSGRNIFVFLQKTDAFPYYYESKSRVITSYHIISPLRRAVDFYDNKGDQIKFVNHPALINYWGSFNSISKYATYFKVRLGQVASVSAEVDFKGCFVTKIPNFYVGGVLKINNSNIILLPNLQWELVRPDELLGHIIEIDKYLKRDNTKSIQPIWVNPLLFPLHKEINLEADITDNIHQQEELEKTRIVLEIELDHLRIYRELLFENGKRLEQAILQFLRLIGFTAERYLDADSEFDAVFSSPEGRFVGEAEGKDNAAIDITKFDQLSRNIDEDLKKDETRVAAKGVLFGNAFRVKPLDERGEFFTEKCINSAKSKNFCLIRTPDLFWISHYLLENPSDEKFMGKCRRKILLENGIVNLTDIIPSDSELHLTLPE